MGGHSEVSGTYSDVLGVSLTSHHDIPGTSSGFLRVIWVVLRAGGNEWFDEVYRKTWDDSWAFPAESWKVLRVLPGMEVPDLCTRLI